MSWVSHTLELIKIRILFAANLTILLGYMFYTNLNQWRYVDIFWLCLGCSFVFAAAAALNHVLEIKTDSLMDRTKNRPLPQKKIKKEYVIVWIIVGIVVGSLILFYKTNNLVLISALATFFLYDFVYTPLKKISHINTFVGAIPGAIPVFCGWFLVYNSVNLPIIIVFLILYFWQLPHFYAIAWMNKDSYKVANLKMISFNDTTGKKTVTFLIWTSLIFIILTYLPFILKFFHIVYIIGVSCLHVFLIRTIISFYKQRSYINAKKILIASVMYPQAILIFVIVDKLLSSYS